MLQLILGRSGTGKTHEVLNRLCDLAWAGNDNLILLVPEQFSFESERILLRRLSPRMAGRVRVLSFTRMAEQVFRETGGLAGRRMDDISRTLVMSRAAELTADKLTLYGNAAGDPWTVGTLLHTVCELKQCGITPSQLEKMSLSIPDNGTLRRKLSELSLLYGTYEALASNVQGADEPDGAVRYIDPLDDLTALAERLPQSGMAKDAYVFVDSFKGFTAPEMSVLRALMRQSRLVTVTLCADGIDDNAQQCGLFSPVIRTAARLRDIARRDGVEVAKVQILNENRRAQSEALKSVEAGLFAPRPAVYEKPTDRVTIASCSDIYEECDFVAREIRRRLREYGGRCRDFSIVARNPEQYRGVLDAAMEKQGIPFIMDQRTDILTEPLITLMLAALDTVTGGFETDDILRLIKTGLAGFSTHSVSLLENYALMWNIDRARWHTEWTGNPDGLTARSDDSTAKRLWYLNVLRRRLTRPLKKLHDTIYKQGATGADFAKALYRYISDVRADRLTRMRIYGLDKAGEHILAERMAQIWDMAMQLLDKMAIICGGQPCSPAKMTELFRLAAGLADMGSLPQSLDAVQVGAADRVRFSSPKTVFIMGANEGVFPAYPAFFGILTDSERRTLLASGLDLYDTADSKAAEERFFAYAAVAAPSESLVVSFVRSNAAGEDQCPSVLVDAIKRVVPNCRYIDQNGRDVNEPESERDAFEYAASLWGQATPRAAALRQVFERHERYMSRLAALDSAYARKPAAFSDSERARRLFGKDMNLSASRVEEYYRCRFAYFCRYGLKVEPSRTADLDALTFGTLAHWVMEHVLPGYMKTGLDRIKRGDAYSDAEKAVYEFAQTTMGGLHDKTDRFVAMLGRLARIAGALLWQVVCELRQSRFVPVDYELSIGYPSDKEQSHIPPVVLTLADGCNVRVYGKIDRVDVYKRGDISYVRVVDYKTGAKEFCLSDVVEGINVQMLLYLFAVWQNGSPRYGRTLPAGVLYLPAKLPVVQVDRDADEQTVLGEQLKALKMNGLILDDAQVANAMESGVAGVFIPAKLNKDGSFAGSSSIASLNQFGLLKKKMDELLIKMAHTLRSGDIAARPAAGREDACKWCSYRAVCGHEPDDPVRFIAKRDAADVLKELEHGDNKTETV